MPLLIDSTHPGPATSIPDKEKEDPRVNPFLTQRKQATEASRSKVAERDRGTSVIDPVCS